MPAISPGIICLTVGYVFSQFYRAFLAVLAPVLGQELAAGPGDLALSSGLWFITFAAMQLPVGWALDHFGPRRTVAVLLGLGGGGGAALFAMAQTPTHLHLAMALLGVGCAPVLMGAYYIFAREYRPTTFGALAGLMIGVGSLGNILGAAPLVWVIETLGWRMTLWLLAAATVVVSGLIGLTLRDPARLGSDHPKGSIGDVLRLRALWFILPIFFFSYAAPMAIRGLWAAPYLDQVFGASEQTIGRATLVIGLAMILGNFLIGAATRIVGSIRRTVQIFIAVELMLMTVLVLYPSSGLAAATVLLSLIGFSGAAYALLMAHGRSFLPAHLVGRGVTFLNMFSMGGVGVMQFASRPVYQTASAAYPPAQAFAMLFLFFLIPLVIGYILYFLTPEADHG